MCREEETAITGPSTAVTAVPADAIYGAQIANVKGWDSFKDGESELVSLLLLDFKTDRF